MKLVLWAIILKFCNGWSSQHRSKDVAWVKSTLKNRLVAGALLPLSFSLLEAPIAQAQIETATSLPPQVHFTHIPTSLALADVVNTKSVRTPSGLEYFDVEVGTGPEIAQGKTVQFQWVLRRSNGYFVDSSANYGTEGGEPFIYRVGQKDPLKVRVIAGVDEGLIGMRQGGIRRMNIPPQLAFVEGVGDGKPGPMPAGFGPRRQIITRVDKEVWYYEVKVTKVKG
jgi:hypothetical protein